MSKSLKDALSQNAWSVSAVMFDLNAMHDDEGRPVSERRADAMARVDVEMEMKLCPFSDIRKDKWMNVSALEQITRYLNPVLEEMEAFRRYTKNKNASWEEILDCVIDQLASPAIYLLQQQSQGPVPAKVAVGHKLAAGMFGVMRGLFEQRALGNNDLPVTVDSFMKLIDDTDALVGATYEACAGSIAMIRKATTALIDGNSDNQLQLDSARLNIARGLSLQVQLGIFWHLYDRVHFWQLVRGEFREHMVPCNTFLQNKVELAGNELDPQSPPRPDSAWLPASLDALQRQNIIDALNDNADRELLEQDLVTATELLNEPGSVIGYKGDIESFALSVASYLHTYRLFEAELSRIELELREQLNLAKETPIRLGAAVLPTPQALLWYEHILGRKLGADSRLTGNNTKIAKPVSH